MKLPGRSLAFLIALLCVTVSASPQSKTVSFNLSTSKSFAPGEQPKIHLYTRNVDALEFRVYRVDDPVRFLENLHELHSFGEESPYGSGERIDERTWLERFHDWKADLWFRIRQFFRNQFSPGVRGALRQRERNLSHRSRIVGAAEFAQIPLLNSRQLVARWRQQVPSTFISDANDLQVPKLTAGLYLVEATDGHYKAYTLLMVSQMALITRTSAGRILADVVDRVSGAPVAGARVDAGLGQKQLATGITGADGLAELAVSHGSSESEASEGNIWVVAAKDSEVAASTPASYALANSATGKWAAYIYTDRPVYRPGHTVHWKAILRERTGNALTLPKPGNVHVSIVDEQEKVIFDRSMPINPAGFVAGDFDLPRDVSLGYDTLRIGDGDNAVTGDFHVEEYRKPEYRVQVTAAQKRLLQGATMSVTIDSRYFFGEPVANAKVKYRVYHAPHYWYDEGDDADTPEPSLDPDTPADGNTGMYDADEDSEKTGKLDADGKLVIQVPTHVPTGSRQHQDQDYTVEAGVTDAANREITGRGRFLATYGAFRLRIEPVSYAIRPGELARFRVTAVDYDNKPVSTRVQVRLVFHHFENGETRTTEAASTDIVTDASGHGAGCLPTGEKTYQSAELVATAAPTQPGTRPVDDSTSLWIMGASDQDYGGGDSTDTIRIVADKKTYVPGDTAHLSLIAETSDFHALVLAQGYAVQKRVVMHSPGRTLSFDLPITADSQPNVSVEAFFIKDNTLYQASKTLKVPPARQQLQVQITPARDVFQPQQTALYDVVTRNFAGKPVAADLSFGVVDEAIYSLYPDGSGDMVSRLFPQRFVMSQLDSSLTYFFSGEAGTKSPLLAMRNARFHPQLAQVKPGNEAKPRVRKAFPDTAFWAPSVRTDASGHARVSLTFPDSLTTWRATVHAITAASEAGSAISRVLVRKNILVRMGTPRFLRKGDEITIPVIVHNYLPTAADATVSLKVEGLDTVSGSTQTVSIPSQGEATVSWRLLASSIGAAKLIATAVAPAESDALELTFPVEPDGVARDLPRSGIVGSSAAEAQTNIAFPANTDPAAHSLRIEASPSIAGSLFSALDYLTSFPYGCTEQTMSSYLPNVSVARTLQRLHLSGRVDEAALGSKMQAGLDRLADYQHEDGGWGWWKEDRSLVYMTAYVVGGLGQGAEAVPLRPKQTGMLSRGMDYLRGELKSHPRMRPDLRAAVVYALAEAGDRDLKAPLDLQWSRRNDLEPEPLAMTGLAMLKTGDDRAAAIATLLTSRATQTGDLVFWKGSYVPLLDLVETNDAEATAYSMRLLAQTQPTSPLLPAAAQWLMLHRDEGLWWESTEQTAMVLFGLVDYLAISHELDSDFTAEILVNGRSAGQRHFTPADTLAGASLAVTLDPAALQPGTNTVQVVRRNGAGPIYWSAVGKFFSTDKRDAQAGTLSLNLTRDYLRLEPTQKNGKIVYTLQPLGPQAQIGDILAVHEAINGSPMKYLLLEDPIPAGAEFVTSEDSYPIEHRPGGWYGWYTRRELRDEHAAFFSTDFSGRQEIFYLLKVVNPGSFHISPARVEPMYQRDIQATSDALHLDVPAPAGPPQASIRLPGGDPGSSPAIRRSLGEGPSHSPAMPNSSQAHSDPSPTATGARP